MIVECKFSALFLQWKFSNVLFSKHIKILKSLREKYAILKPDKGNGIVLIKKTDYENCLTVRTIRRCFEASLQISR